ncbi:MAG: hypothetical protein QXU88_00570 [Candidatus Woesearchaeota archaeon]
MRLGQIVGQIFLFLLATIVFVFIVVYGYRAIGNLVAKGEQADLVRFNSELSSAVSAISLDYGSVRCLELSLPKRYRTFCFVGQEPDIGALSLVSPLIASAVQSGIKQNVFLIPPSPLQLYLEKATTKAEGGFFCINTSGPTNRLLLRLEGGAGGIAELQKWQGASC